jgi:TonB family protein
MKKASWALALASTMVITSAAWAVPQTSDSTIEVSAHDGVSEWSRQAARELDANLSYPRPVKGDYNVGLVKVQFRSDSSGRISDVALLESSKKADLDMAALRAVRRSETLAPPPASIAAGRPVQAWIYFASTERDEAKMLDRVHRDLAMTNRTAATEPLIVTMAAQ